MNGSSAGVPPVMIACDFATVRTCWCSIGFRCNWRWRSGWVLCWLLALSCLSSCGCWVSLDGLVSADCILLFLADGLRPLVVHCVARPLCAPPGCGVLARGPPVEGRRVLWSWRLGMRGIGASGGARCVCARPAPAVWGRVWLRPGGAWLAHGLRLALRGRRRGGRGGGFGRCTWPRVRALRSPLAPLSSIWLCHFDSTV